jgi:hypothetical protein
MLALQLARVLSNLSDKSDLAPDRSEDIAARLRAASARSG